MAAGMSLQREGRLAEAHRAFEQLGRITPRDARPMVWLGMIAMQQHRIPDAIACFDEALRRDPSDADVTRSVGELYERAGAFPKALPMYERAAQLQPSYGPGQRLLGLADVRMGRLSRGREALKHAIDLDSSDFKARAALGDLDVRLGMLEEARRCYGALLSHSPKDPDALVGAARVTVLLDPTPGGLRRAETQTEEAAAAGAAMPKTLLIRGQIALLRQDYAGAIRELSRATSGDPNLAEAYGYLSQAYAATGQTERARRAAAEHNTASERRRMAEARAAQ
jgi:tetratricopeptide (TPR) repeat protein